MTVKEALQNIRIVVSNTRMTGPEHDTLKQNLLFIAQRCKLADELEEEKNGGTDKQTDLCGPDSESSE